MANWRLHDSALSRGEAQLVLMSSGPSPAVDAEKARLLADALEKQHSRRLVQLASVRRVGVLRLEAVSVFREEDQAKASIARATAARAESIQLARPGWSGVVADLDRELIQLHSRLAEIQGRVQALRGPMTEARAAANADIVAARGQAAAAGAEACQRRYSALMGAIGQLLGELLDQAAAAKEGADACNAVISGLMLGVQPTGTENLDQLADEAVRTQAAGTAAA